MPEVGAKVCILCLLMCFKKAQIDRIQRISDVAVHVTKKSLSHTSNSELSFEIRSC